MTKFSGWGYTDATNFMACAECGAKPGEICRTKSGHLRTGHIPHIAREKALYVKYGAKPWTGGPGITFAMRREAFEAIENPLAESLK